MRILFLTKAERKTVYAALISQAERSQEAADEEFAGSADEDSLRREAHDMARMARRVGRGK